MKLRLNLLKWSLVVFIAHTASSQQSDRDRQDEYNRDRNRDQQYGQDPYGRNRDDNNRDNYNRNPPYNPNDPYARNNQTDPYNRDRNQDPYSRDRNQDPYSRNNSGNPYNRNQSGGDQYGRERDPNDPYNTYNRNNQTDPYNRDRNQDPYNRNPSDPYNRNNQSTNRNYDRNDPYNRNQDTNKNDPYNRNNDPYNRNNDPYNRNPDDRDRDRDRFGSGGTGGSYGGASGGSYGSGTGGSYGGGSSDRFDPDEYCYTVDEQPYVKLGSKTPYQFAYGKVSNQHIVPQCKPVQFWSVVRKGTSLPDRKSLERYKALQKLHDDIMRNYEERRSFPDKGRLCAEDYDNLKRWRWNDTVSDFNADTLSQQGSDDLKFLARRYQTRLRDLLVPYSENQYYFQYTDGDKSHDTYMAYIQGLFGADASRVHASVRSNPNNMYGGGGSSNYNSNSQYSPYSPSSSSSNQYSSQNSYSSNSNPQYGSSGSQYGSSNSYSGSQYGSNSNAQYGSNPQYGGGQFGSELPYSPEARCKTIEQRMDDGRNTSAEYQSFKRKPEYKEMVQNVFKRLGFKYANEPLIEDMYDLCRLEKSWYVTRPSPWCAAFTPKQLKLLEYADDLFYYYRSGYGHEMLNRNLGCGLLKDMYDRFEKTVNSGFSEQKGIVHFRDLDAILRTFVAMGIGRDQSTLIADNYYQLTRRQWRLADLAPFSANLAAVLYQCDNQADKYKVMFFLNENPVEFPECSVGLCQWNTIKEKFQLIAQQCQLDWCERGSATVNTVSCISITICAVLASIYKFVF